MMFAHYAVRRNIIYAVNIIAEGNITCLPPESKKQCNTLDLAGKEV